VVVVPSGGMKVDDSLAEYTAELPSKKTGLLTDFFLTIETSR